VAAVFRSDGSLVTVGVNDTAYIWDVTARPETSEMAAPRRYDFQRAAFSPDGDTMAAQAGRGVTYVFRGIEGSPTNTLPAGERLYPGSIATAGLTIVTEDEARTGADVWVGEASTPVETLINPDHGADLTSVALSVDGATVAASDNSGRTYLWDANTATRTHVLEPPDGSDVSCSVFSFGGGLLVTGDRDGRAYLWNAATGALLRSVRDPSGIVDTVAIGEDGRLLATAGTGNAIYLWDAATGASLGTISDPGGSGVNSLAFSMMGAQLAVAHKNGTTYVWSLAG
jgi:WD40 repeat protein